MEHGLGAIGRLLSGTSAQEDFEYGSKMAQIFSGVLFAALAGYLIFSNSTRLSYIQRASLEKRLNVCCQLNTIVAAFSAFFNFFQITEVDNFALPGDRNFTVDAARPIEWICTCPLMQLCLVLMGGSRIPEYRRIMMPMFSVTILLCGAATMFVEDAIVYVFWGVGFVIFLVMVSFNRLQILEHSKGIEGLFTGDSEFRKATLILIATWFPFPLWYLLSPEGISLIENVVIIQMGWAFLNITAKFSSAFYMQRIKDNYCNRLKVKREMHGGAVTRGVIAEAADFDGASPNGDKGFDRRDVEERDRAKISGELSACVVETMNFLGMAENIERFLRLLKQAKIWCLEDILYLTKEDCKDLQLPWDLITALQKRTKVWRMEMIDDAEKGLEIGEKHYSIAEQAERQASKEPPSPGRRMRLLDAPDNSDNEVQNPNAMVGTDDAPKQNHEYVNIEGSGHNANGFSTTGFATSHMVSGNGFGKRLPFATMDGTMTPFAGKDPNALTSDYLEKRLEKLENRMFDKMEHSFHSFSRQLDQSFDRLAMGMNDMGKAMEKTQGQLESKVEHALTSQSHLQDTCSTALQNQLQGMQEFSENAFQRMTEAYNAQTASAENDCNFSTQTIQQSVNNMNMQMQDLTRVIDELKGRQQNPSNTTTQMPENWSQMVLQNFQSTAFELQSHMNQQEKTQIQKQAELEERITRTVEMVVIEGTGSLRSIVEEKLQNFSEHVTNKFETSIEMHKVSQTNAFTTGSGQLEDLSQQIRGVGQDCAKNIEVGFGFFSNSLRTQLESMQSQQMQQITASENNTSKRLESVANSLHEQSQKDAQKLDARCENSIHDSAARVIEDQRKGFEAVKEAVEETTNNQRTKTQDMHSMLAAVLEQTIGAKDRSAECSQKVSRLWEELGYHEPHPVARTLDRPPSAQRMPSQPHVGRQDTGRQPSQPHVGRQDTGKQSAGSRYSQYGSHVMNS
jgi:bacteriorhodopsin